MDLISREELKGKLDRGDVFKLVMVLDDWHFRAMHIPGSVQIRADEMSIDALDINDEIVVYCTNNDCPASRIAYDRLKSLGFDKVRRYPGGIFEWEQAGYPVEGEMANHGGNGQKMQEMIDLQVFITPYCPPCTFAARTAEHLKEEFPNLRVTTVDVSEQPQMAKEYQIYATPGVVINGKLEFHGGVNETQLRDKLRQIS